MLKSNSIIIVEGKTDTIKLKSIFPNIRTIETNGFAINQEIINLIKKSLETNDVICFLDPDGPGKKIRDIIIKNIPNLKHAFIDRKLINNKKIGVAEANDQDIINSLSNLLTFNNLNNSLTWNEYLDLNLNSKLKRKIICDYYNIPLYNHKQLFNILNMLNTSYDNLKKIIGERNE